MGSRWSGTWSVRCVNYLEIVGHHLRGHTDHVIVEAKYVSPKDVGTDRVPLWLLWRLISFSSSISYWQSYARYYYYRYDIDTNSTMTYVYRKYHRSRVQHSNVKIHGTFRAQELYVVDILRSILGSKCYLLMYIPGTEKSYRGVFVHVRWKISWPIVSPLSVTLLYAAGYQVISKDMWMYIREIDVTYTFTQQYTGTRIRYTDIYLLTVAGTRY